MAARDNTTEPVVVTSASKQDEPKIARMIQFMLYELSPFHGEWIDADGCYEYEYLSRYWSESGRLPYLILKNAQLAGFALVMNHSPITGRSPCWFMAEFFILKAQRRRGYGRQAFHRLIAKHAGPWEIAVRCKNHPAQRFWDAALADHETSGLRRDEPKHDGSEWIVHEFTA